jgi:hypothetical protein
LFVRQPVRDVSDDAETDGSGGARVALELLLALNGVAVGALAAAAVGPGPPWAFGGGAAAGFAAAAVSDRHPLGYLALASLGVVLGALVVWATVGGPRWVVSVAVAGLGAGVGANRLLFGVVRPLPPIRRRRGRRGSWID